MKEFTSEMNSRFESLMADVMSDGCAAGILAAVIGHDGTIKHIWNRGYRDFENQLLIDNDTIFGLASISKSFTALAIMQLEEAGKLSIDDPVSKYIAEYSGVNQERPLLIRHFLSHSGGFLPQTRILMEDVAEEMGLTLKKDGDFSYIDALEAEGTRRVAERLDKQTEFFGHPGDNMSYCNDGFGLLSHIVMKVSGEPSFAHYIDKYILKPLGMGRSYCDFIAPRNDPNSAIIYNVQDGERVISDNLDNAFVLNGGGGMKSTLNDMAKYIALYLGGGVSPEGVRIASRRTITEMTKPRQVTGLNSYYGYGLMMNQLGNNMIFRHGGSLPGVSSHFAWSEEMGCGVVVLCNTESVSVAAVADSLLRLLLGLDPLDTHIEYDCVKWSDEVLASVEGEYASDEGARFSIKLNENGYPIYVSGDKQTPLITIGPRRALLRRKFDYTNLEAYLDDKGEVFGMRLSLRIIPKMK